MLNKLEEYLCAGLIMFMAVLTFLNVIARYLTEQSLAFTEELVVNLFVLATLLGASIAFRKGAHLGVSLFADRFLAKYKKAVIILSAVSGVAIFGILLYHGVGMVIQEYKSEMTTYSMGLPMWWFGLAVPVGAMLAIIRVVQAAVAELNGWR